MQVSYAHVFIVRVTVTQFEIVTQHVLEGPYSGCLDREYRRYESGVRVVRHQGEHEARQKSSLA